MTSENKASVVGTTSLHIRVWLNISRYSDNNVGNVHVNLVMVKYMCVEAAKT